MRTKFHPVLHCRRDYVGSLISDFFNSKLTRIPGRDESPKKGGENTRLILDSTFHGPVYYKGIVG
jgi:hypothetical protein